MSSEANRAAAGMLALVVLGASALVGLTLLQPIQDARPAEAQRATEQSVGDSPGPASGLAPRDSLEAVDAAAEGPRALAVEAAEALAAGDPEASAEVFDQLAVERPEAPELRAIAEGLRATGRDVSDSYCDDER